MGASPNLMSQGVEAGVSVISGGIAGAAGITSALGAASTAGLIGGVGAATAGIGAAVAGIILLATQLFKGCGSGCVDSAEIEQVYEAASDNILALQQGGYLTQAETVAAFNAMIQAGQQAYAKFPQLGVHGTNGLRNMVNVLDAQIQAAGASPGGTAPLPSNYESVFKQPGTPGWYANSLQSAYTLSQQIVSQIIGARSVAASVPVVGPALAKVSAATGIKSSYLLAGGAALIAVKVFHLL